VSFYWEQPKFAFVAKSSPKGREKFTKIENIVIKMRLGYRGDAPFRYCSVVELSKCRAWCFKYAPQRVLEFTLTTGGFS
jgi:hypothetical protein